MLHLKNLTYHPPASPTAILKSINLDLDFPQLGLVVGPSGSGKSTLLEVLAGFVEKTKGEIFWRERELLPFDLRSFVGLVFQFPERHFCGGTILEELRLGHPELSSEQIETALAEVGLAHLSLKTAPQALSGGQQRRLALAVQLIRGPHLLLLDEPTAGLDWSMRRQLINLLPRLKQIQQAERSLLVVTHDAGDLLEIADRCWTLNHGELQEADPKALRNKSAQPKSIA